MKNGLKPQGGDEGEEALEWLFLDLNSYFASVEQQEDEALRGRPVAVVPTTSDHTCAIAASYEAKAYGIKTGTKVGEAKRLCRDLVCVPARHQLYVQYHHRIREEIERHVPIEVVASIDEVACRLTGCWREPRQAVELARKIKCGLRERIGVAVRCSIGLSTNRFLAKVATDLQKPDGLVTLHPQQLPLGFRGLKPRDLPGIGAQMERKLAQAGIVTVLDMWYCPVERFRQIWGSVEGERMWWALRGKELPAPSTNRSTVGHSHVLDPAQRDNESARLVGTRLLLKAAARLRDYDTLCQRLTLSVGLEQTKERYEVEVRFAPLCDSVSLQRLYTDLWEKISRETKRARIKKVSLSLCELVSLAVGRQLELPLAFSDEEVGLTRAGLRGERLSQAMDELNRRFGHDTVTLGLLSTQGKSFTGTKIAFTRVPEVREFGA
jgi:DNA polymerase IV